MRMTETKLREGNSALIYHLIFVPRIYLGPNFIGNAFFANVLRNELLKVSEFIYNGRGQQKVSFVDDVISGTILNLRLKGIKIQK